MASPTCFEALFFSTIIWKCSLEIENSLCSLYKEPKLFNIYLWFFFWISVKYSAHSHDLSVCFIWEILIVKKRSLISYCKFLYFANVGLILLHRMLYKMLWTLLLFNYLFSVNSASVHWHDLQSDYVMTSVSSVRRLFFEVSVLYLAVLSSSLSKTWSLFCSWLFSPLGTIRVK